MNRNYPKPYQIISYDRAVDLANQAKFVSHYVACAAAAISDTKRDVVDIFFNPTEAELDHIAMALEEYLKLDHDGGEECSAEEIMDEYKKWLSQ